MRPEKTRMPKKTKRTGKTRTSRVVELPVAGWREWVGLPSLGVDRIKAKIDSGARTSAIHAYKIRLFPDRGAPHVSFILHPEQRRAKPAIDCVAEIRDERMVRSSNGLLQCRYVIEVDVSLGGRTWPIELTLADRDQMGFRMLLGREAVRRRFLIDTNRSYLAGFSYADVTTVLPERTD